MFFHPFFFSRIFYLHLVKQVASYIPHPFDLIYVGIYIRVYTQSRTFNNLTHFYVAHKTFCRQVVIVHNTGVINFERKKIKQTCISRQAFVKSVGLSAEYSPICMFVLQEWGLFCLLANTRVSGGIYGPCVNSKQRMKMSR